MNQRQVNIRTRTNGDTRRYYLRLAIAAAVGFTCSLLATLALPGDIRSSHAHASSAPVVLLFAIPACVLFLMALFLLGEMGHWRACHTGTIRSGIWAAAIAGVCFSLGAGLVSIGAITSALLFGPYPGMTLLGLVTGMLNGALTYGIVGVIAGGIGAALGRSQYRRRRNELTPEGEWRAGEKSYGRPVEVCGVEPGMGLDPSDMEHIRSQRLYSHHHDRGVE